MFLTLPPPTSVVTPPRSQTNLHVPPTTSSSAYHCSPASAAPAPSMSHYHSAAASCFHGSCLVTMSDSTTKVISSIRQGDYVQCPYSGRLQSSSSKNIRVIAKVESILRTFSASGMMNLVCFENGLLVTPWHPLQIDGRWIFPADIRAPVHYPTEAVYSFLLGPEIILDLETNKLILDNNFSDRNACRGQSMLINEMVCITLGHGIENDPVATHLFYGTELVVQEMREMNGGLELLEYVDLLEGDVVRDPLTQLVCGFRPAILPEEHQIEPIESCLHQLIETY